MSNFLWPQAPLSLDYSPPGSFVLGILQARILQWVASPSPGDSPSQGWNLGLLPCVQILYCLSSKGSPYTNLNVNQNTIPEMWNFLVESLRKIQTENCSCLYSSSISCAFWIKLTTCVCWGGGVSPVWLFGTVWTAARQAPLSMGIFQARILEWFAMPSSSRSSQPRDQTQVSHIVGRFFTDWVTREAHINHIITHKCSSFSKSINSNSLISFFCCGQNWMKAILVFCL